MCVQPQYQWIQRLLDICVDFAAEREIAFNCNKTIGVHEISVNFNKTVGVLFCPKEYEQPIPSKMIF